MQKDDRHCPWNIMFKKVLDLAKKINRNHQRRFFVANFICLKLNPAQSNVYSMCIVYSNLICIPITFTNPLKASFSNKK